MSTALSTLRWELGRQLGLFYLIPAGKLDSIAAGSITSADILRDSNQSSGKYKGEHCVIYRGASASAADNARYAGLLTNTSGLLAHTGANYADTTSTAEYVELWRYGVRPDQELVDSLNRVLEFEYIPSWFMISHLSGLDGDMAASVETAWTDIGTVTTTKGTTTALTPYGLRSYRALNGAANGGTRSSGYRIRQSGNWSAFAIVSTEVGTSYLQGYNTTGSAAFGTQVSSSEREAQLLCIPFETALSTQKMIALNLTNDNAAGDSYWNQAGLYNWDDLTMYLPTPVTDGYMAPRIYRGIPYSGNVNANNNTFPARSIEMVPLTEGVDYWLIINHADAEPYKVRFRDSSYYQWPLFVKAQRPASDLTTFSTDDTATTTVAKHNLLPRWKLDVLRTIYNGAAAPRHPDWANQVALAESQIISANRARPKIEAGRVRPYNAGVSRL